MYGQLTDNDDLDQFSDQEIVAKTAWGEARGLGQQGMQATINTIQNRLASGVTWWGDSLRTIALHPWQYSCWNNADPNRPKLLSVTETDEQYAAALQLAANAISGQLDDISNQADSYYDDRMPAMPRWADGLTAVCVIGTQKYFKTV